MGVLMARPWKARGDGRAVYFERIPWHDKPLTEDEIRSSTKTAMCLAKCCGQGCSRCRRGR